MGGGALDIVNGRTRRFSKPLDEPPRDVNICAGSCAEARSLHHFRHDDWRKILGGNILECPTSA